MINISIDTSVWLELLKIDFRNEDNYFEELCYWIENKCLNHIVSENIITEWNRNKIKYQSEIIEKLKSINANDVRYFRHNTELISTYQADIIVTDVDKRVKRVDVILNILSEKAPHNDDILKDAGNRNLQTFAPNHIQDSFRDTVNILSLISYLKAKGHTNCIFTTLNYKDFSADGGNRYDLHTQLSDDFEKANLSYEYFGENTNFGLRLFNHLRKQLSLFSYQAYLKDKKSKEEAIALAAKKAIAIPPIETPDADYLENIKYIDMILSKKKPTALEEQMLKIITSRHDSYKRYFLRNVGSNGMV